MLKRINPDVDLKNYYTILLQSGMLIALIFCILAAKADLASINTVIFYPDEPEVPITIEIPVTDQIKSPPPPQRQPVPVPVPDHEIIEDIDIDISSDFNNEPLILPDRPENDKDDGPRFGAEIMPELIGGLSSLQRSINYPEMARRAGIEGRVYIQFVVNERGEVENPVVLRGIGGGADEEALRVVSQAKFRPGFQGGKPVKVQYTIPVVFQLQN